MKRFYILLISGIMTAASLAQGYTEQQLSSVLDSLGTNPDYVAQWADQAVAKNAKCADAYFVRACAYMLFEDPQNAIQSINSAIKYVSKKSVVPKTDLLCFRGMMYENIAEYELALADYSAAIKIDTKYLDAYEKRITLYNSLSYYEAAEAECIKLLAVKDSVDYHLELAAILNKQNKAKEALELLNQVIEKNPQLAEPYATRAWVYATQEKGPEAIYDYVMYMVFGGDYELDHLIALSSLDPEYTIELLSYLVENDSQNLTWVAAKIRVGIASKQYAIAMEAIENYETQIGKSDEFALYQKALCYDGLHEYIKEVNTLTQLIYMLPYSDEYIHIKRALALEEAGYLAEAMTEYSKVLIINPDNVWAYWGRGVVYDLLGNIEMALKDYSKALNYEKERAELYVSRGKALLAMGEQLISKADFEKALQLDSTSSTAAFALTLLGESEKGIKLMEKLVSEDITSIENQYNLACIYALANQQKQAIEALSRAVGFGYSNEVHIAHDRDLENIRQEQGYLDIMHNLNRINASKPKEELILTIEEAEEDGEILPLVDKMPEFPGGQHALFKYLGENIIYPEIALGIEGRVICQFIVNKNGHITEVEVVRSSGDQRLDQEALRVIKQMPQWIPGEKDGEKVRVQYTLPINFRLQ